MKKHLIALGLLLGLGTQAGAAIDIQFDFSYDSTGFFTGHAERRSALDAAAAVFETRFADSLDAIVSSGENNFNFSFFNPSSSLGMGVTLGGQSLDAGVIRIFVGAADLGSRLGMGGPGGFDCWGAGSFCVDAVSRGQGNTSGTGATDFGPWGGAISFSSTANWHFGLDTAGLTGSQNDFYSVAVHELAHVLGFGTADSFGKHVGGGRFVGPSTGSVALDSEGHHWAAGTRSAIEGSGSFAANMVPALLRGTRAAFTDLDYAAMNDIGWQVTAVPEAQTWTMFVAGLGVLTLARRRRKA